MKIIYQSCPTGPRKSFKCCYKYVECFFEVPRFPDSDICHPGSCTTDCTLDCTVFSSGAVPRVARLTPGSHSNIATSTSDVFRGIPSPDICLPGSCTTACTVFSSGAVPKPKPTRPGQCDPAPARITYGATSMTLSGHLSP